MKSQKSSKQRRTLLRIRAALAVSIIRTAFSVRLATPAPILPTSATIHSTTMISKTASESGVGAEKRVGGRSEEDRHIIGR